MLLVILGAGASYDSVPSRLPKQPNPHLREPYRPPLADQLFEARESFLATMRLLPQVMQIAPSLLYPSNGRSVEEILERYANQAKDYGPGATQLAAVRFYLQAIIAECEKLWVLGESVPTNLMGLIDQIERARRGRERPIFVTFNYDRLIEDALINRGQPFITMNDYIADDRIRVFKLHGSVDWCRSVGHYDSSLYGDDPWTVARNVADHIKELTEIGDIQRGGPIPTSRNANGVAIPALSIPVREKSLFECPASHIDALKAALPKVKTVLTIGWRGSERHFLRLLNESGLQFVDGICVGGTEEDAEETKRNLMGCIPSRFSTYAHGFSNFLITNELQRLLNITWNE